jgi:hypothetical protein
MLAILVALALMLSTLGGLLFVLQQAFSGPTGSSADYRFLVTFADGTPERWNPCEPIRYVVNPDSAPPGSIEDVHEAVERTSHATGISFVYDGLTDEVPRAEREGYQPARYGDRWAPVLIAWVNPSRTDIAFTSQGHEAAAVASPIEPRGDRIFVSGWIAMSEQDLNPPGFGRPGDQGPVLLHELGHVMGLNHVQAPDEVMEPSGGYVTDFGRGDLEGLHQLGAGGCLTTPTPGF